MWITTPLILVSFIFYWKFKSIFLLLLGFKNYIDVFFFSEIIRMINEYKPPMNFEGLRETLELGAEELGTNNVRFILLFFRVLYTNNKEAYFLCLFVTACRQ